VKVLEFIGKKEGLQLPPGFAARVAAKANRSLRRAILLLETCRVQQLSSRILLLECWLFRVLIESFSYHVLVNSYFYLLCS